MILTISLKRFIIVKIMKMREFFPLFAFPMRI